MNQPSCFMRLLPAISIILLLTIGLSPRLYTFISEKKEGCTSWIAISNALEEHNTIFHKTRDMSDEDPMVAREISNGLYKYIGFTSFNDNPDKLYVWGGVNEKGLAAGSNYIGGFKLDGKYGGPSVCREVLELCDSVESAYSWISDNKNSFSSGNIIFLADKNRGAVVEVKVNLL